MNTVRIFALAAAILITAALFAVVGDALVSEPPIGATAAAHALAYGSQSLPERPSP